MKMSLPGASRTKRKTLDDYFVTQATKRRPSSICSQRPRKDSSKNIPGLRLLEKFVSADEERLALEFLDKQKWRTDLARRVIHYGGTYCLMPPQDADAAERQKIQSTIIQAASIPSELGFIVDKMIQHELYTSVTRPEFCIVNEYKNDQGISAHVENFRFLSPVCGLTLVQGDWMRFHELSRADDGSVRSGKARQAQRTGRRQDVWMPARSLLVMSGEVREKWQHEIPRTRRGRNTPSWRRVSLTFRTTRTASMTA